MIFFFFKQEKTNLDAQLLLKVEVSIDTNAVVIRISSCSSECSQKSQNCCL